MEKGPAEAALQGEAPPPSSSSSSSSSSSTMASVFTDGECAFAAGFANAAAAATIAFAAVFAASAAPKGLTRVHCSAQREYLLWDRGCI
jgi:hypothetical protein